MPLPKVSQEDIAEVEAANVQEVRDNAVAQVETAPAPEETKAVAAPTTGTAVGQADAVEAYDPMAFLAELGITDLKIDYTSFPTITLDKGNFVCGGAALGQEFEFMYMDKRRTFLFRGADPADRDADALLCYTDDKKTANSDGRLVADHVAEWKAKVPNVVIDDTEYYVVMVKLVGGERDGELAQLQISKTSTGRLDGYLVSLAMNRQNPKATVTKATVGELLGTGKRTWNPWDFKKA